MQVKRVGLLTVAAILLGLLSVTSARAQAVYGTITGTVSDETGGVLPGVEVTIEDVGKGTSWMVLTDDSGNFRKERLVPGSNYRLTVTTPGFKTYVQENVIVSVDSVSNFSILLAVGEISEEVVVTGQTPVLKAEKTDVGVTLSEKEVKELPIFERNFTRLQLLTPGTQIMTWQHAASENPQGSRQIMVNGKNFGGIGYELDGTTNMDPVLGIIVINPTLESIGEVKIASQNVEGEFGSAVAGVVSAQTKSGTNEFHGSAFLFRRNDEQQARNPFSQSQPLRGETDKFIPDTLWNQFGGSLGGPLVRDKGFFFFDYQGTRRKNGGSILTTVPTLAARDGDLSEYVGTTGEPIFDPLTGDADTGVGRQEFPGGIIPSNRLSPQALNLIRQLPPPTSPGIERNFSGGAIEAFDDDAFNVRGDWTYSENLHVFGRYSFADFRRAGPGAFGELLGGPSFDNIGFAGRSEVRNQSIASGFDYTLSPTFLTDFRFGLLRYRVNVLPGGVGTTPAADAGIPNLNSVPGINQDPLFTSGMPAFFIEGTGGFNFGYALGVNQCNCPLDQSEQQWQWVSNWINIRGDHTLKFGGDIRWATTRRIPSDAARRGQLTFTPDRTRGDIGGGSGLATFLLGEVSSFSRFISETTDASERQRRWFFYGQDTWKVSRKLTLNYGLRWEIYFPETLNEPGRGAWLDVGTGEMRVAGIGDIDLAGNVEASYTDIAPRLGITYQLTDHSVLRLGYGRNFDTGIFGAIFGGTVSLNFPVLIQQNLTTDPFNSVFSLSEGPPTPSFLQPDESGRVTLPDGISATARPDKMRIPTVDSWNVALQHEFAPEIAWEIAYVGNKSTHIGPGDGATGYNINQPIIDPNPEAPGVLTPINSRKPFFAGPIQGLGGPFGLSQGLSYRSFDATSNYHALQTKLERRFSSGWSLLGHYTLSRTRQYEESYFPWDAELNYGPSEHDRTHVFVVNSVVELPFGRGRSFAADLSEGLNALAGGWQVSFTTNWSSGLPFSPTMANCGLLRDTGPCRPDRLSDPQIIGDQDRWFEVGLGPGTPWESPAPGTFGSERKNRLRGPNFFNADFSIFKHFTIREDLRLQFRAEIFNVFNKVSLGNPNSCVDCNPAEDGRISSLAPQFSMRQVQWALRLEF